MKLQTVLLIVVLVAVAVFLIRRARNSGASEYRKRFDSTLPQQDSSYLFIPTVAGSAAESGSAHGQGSDCVPGAAEAGSGCSDGGGGGSH